VQGLTLGLVVAAGLVAAACQRQPDSSPPASGRPALATTARVARFDCDTQGVTVTFGEGRVVLELLDRTMTLPQTPSASGARYSDDTVTFWTKGHEATLTLDDRTETCRVRREPWQEAVDRGVDFRAVGQEPGWFLEIDNERQIKLVYDYAEHELVAPTPPPTISGTTRTYDVAAQQQRLKVAVENRSCRDSMSGEQFPLTVTVTLGDRTLNGCGRDLTAPAAP
jgi:putative lipoprotein